MPVRPLVASLLALLLGCDPVSAAPVDRCGSSADCASGLICIDRRCAARDASAPETPIDAGSDTPPPACEPACAGDTRCEAGRCVRYGRGQVQPSCVAPTRPFAVAPRALCHWPTPGAALAEGPEPWRWARRVASTVVAGTFLPASGEFDVPPTWLVFATGSVLSSSAEEPARWRSGGVLRVLDPQRCALVDTLDEAPVAAWFQPPALGDLDGDGTPEIVAQRWAGDPEAPEPAYDSSGELVAWRWDAGMRRFRVWRRSTVAGAPETDLAYTAGYVMMAGPTIADLDDDGMPEVMLAGRVYDHELRRLTGEAPPVAPLFMSRQPPAGPFVIQQDLVRDLDGDGRAELIYGHAIFTWTDAGWTPASFFAPPVPLTPAHAVVTDLGDLADTAPGALEVVAVGYDGLRIQTIEGRVVRRFDVLTGERGASAPSIANVDDDDETEILVGADAGLFVYDLECDRAPVPSGCGLDTTSGAARPPLPTGVRWADRPPLDAWDYMGATTFDFDGDGAVEVVYADECFLRVYDGETGAVLYSHWRPSRTASEVPIVVGSGDGADTVLAIGLHTARFCTQATGTGGVPPYDAQFPGLSCASDLDCFGGPGTCRGGRCRCTTDAECCGPGEDCVAAGYACHPADDMEGNTCRAVRVPDPSAFASFGALEEGIDVLTDAFGRWAPARPVWNQDAYSVTNVRDDGSIPRTGEARGALTFRSNAPGEAGPTAAADLRVWMGCLAEGAVSVRGEVCNRGLRGAPSRQRVVFERAGAPLCSTLTTSALGPGVCEPVECTVPALAGGDEIEMRVSDDARLPECDGASGNSMTVTVSTGCP
ncbi:MAG: hypothetical protein ACK6CU_31125 [Deltaproteobacteria bacterium]|jgi:hypothetical protein